MRAVESVVKTRFGKMTLAMVSGLAMVALATLPGHATTTTAPLTCGAGNEGIPLTCSGEVIVDDVADTVTLSFLTWVDSGSEIHTLGIQLPGTAIFDAATTDTLNPGYVSGAGNQDFDATLTCTGPCLGDGDAPFSLVFAYTGADFTAADVVALENRTGKCDGFGHTLWGCAHVFRFEASDGAKDSQFVPLRTRGEEEQVPGPAPLALLGLGLFGLGVAVRRKIGR